MEYYLRDNCRLCESPNIIKLFSLEPTPPANAFVNEDNISKKQTCYPLDLFLCNDCFHVQLNTVVDPEILFRDYVYVSGTSSSFISHFEDYAKSVIKRLNLQKSSLVIDIGSNDGTLLSKFNKFGMDVLGVDPATEIAKQANDRGIETLNKYLNEKVVSEIINSKGPADIVCANNVFAHIDDLIGTVNNIKNLLKEDGVFIFEVSYLVDVYEKTLFDMTYHEHLAYHSIRPLVSFFKNNGLELFDIEKIPTHGGSIRGYAQRKDGVHEISSKINELISYEEKIGLHKQITFEKYFENIEIKSDQLNKLLKTIIDDSKVIAGYGAPAKATSLMHHFGLDAKVIKYIIDDSPWKQGMFTPGLHIPVYDRSKLYQDPPDYLVILAWNFSKNIISNNVEFSKLGGKFIIPLPTLEVI